MASMRQLVRRPVHAYLLSGPVGSSLHDAVLSFAAALQCPEFGCGSCEVCRLVLSGNDSDVTFVERSGLTWRVDELRTADRVSRRRPLSTGYQIVVIEDVELTTTGSTPSAPALLKSLEEPPSRTVFLLTAEDVTAALDTIVSRCVEVKLKALRAPDIESILAGEGADPRSARVAAQAAGGNLRRARVLQRDGSLADRITQWRTVPDRLTGTPAASAELASALGASLDQAVAPLVQLQEEEMARLVADAREFGQRAVANRREIEAQFKREQRRFRIDELRFGLSALAGAYRERLNDGLAASERGESRGSYRVGASLRALDAVTETSRRLASNVDETLLLNDLMLTLMEF